MPAEIPLFIQQRLEEQRKNLALRQLQVAKPGQVDFTSNDYLGLASAGLVTIPDSFTHGSTGSRLLSGNFTAAQDLENTIALFHHTPAAVLYNSGYSANLGILSCIAREGDTILYDLLSHASIRDGIKLSRAQAFPFLHNDLEDLERRLKQPAGSVYVVTESLFSMDGDPAPLKEIVELCEKYGAYLIVDEAHATGVVGKKGEGLVQSLGLEQQVFARIHTFGKALGCHGAAVMGSLALKDYLLNFSRPLIYTTSLPPSAIEAIRISYTLFPEMDFERKHLARLADVFQSLHFPFEKLSSSSPIQALMIPGNEKVSDTARHLQMRGFDCRPIRYPTVPKNKERIRIILHAFNKEDEITRLCEELNKAY